MTDHKDDLLERDLDDLAYLYNRAEPSRRLERQLAALPEIGNTLIEQLLRLFGIGRGGLVENRRNLVPLDDSLLDAAVAGVATPGLVPLPEVSDHGDGAQENDIDRTPEHPDVKEED